MRPLFHFPCYRCSAYTRAALIRERHLFESGTYFNYTYNTEGNKERIERGSVTSSYHGSHILDDNNRDKIKQ